MMDPLPSQAPPAVRQAHWRGVVDTLASLLEGEDDWVAAMATIACELHHAFEAWHWTGFYRLVRPDVLVIGPYQGGHGCLRIPVSQGVCGAAVRSRETQDVPDVRALEHHIACSATTRSELVVPVRRPDGSVLAVLDIDSDLPAAFAPMDRARLEELAAAWGRRFSEANP